MSPMDLFESAADKQLIAMPLAERMRPRTIGEMVGQSHLVGEDKLLGRAIAEDRLPSIILWGPPGSGKTTIARVIAESTGAFFASFSAVLGGVKEVRAIIAQAKTRLSHENSRTVLFVDEIHRFNRAQQDAFLPHVERGIVILIGATTENPSFAVTSALLSRCQTLHLSPLEDEHLAIIVGRALSDPERGLGQMGLSAEPEATRALAAGASGDARRALTALELAAGLAKSRGNQAIGADDVEQAYQRRALLYDKSGEEHYNLASAFIKSMRGSDPDAAVYWMVRMLEAGEDPHFLLRRMVIFASEDIGNADPRALQTAVAAEQAVRAVGMPEGIFALTQAATFLSVAAKSNACLKAHVAARQDVEAHGALPVPMHMRNAPTAQMRSWGYGEGYRYPHDNEGGHVPSTSYLPQAIEDRRYYEPTDRGLEGQIQQRLKELRKARNTRSD